MNLEAPLFHCWTLLIDSIFPLCRSTYYVYIYIVAGWKIRKNEDMDTHFSIFGKMKIWTLTFPYFPARPRKEKENRAVVSRFNMVYSTVECLETLQETPLSSKTCSCNLSLLPCDILPGGISHHLITRSPSPRGFSYLK